MLELAIVLNHNRLCEVEISVAVQETKQQIGLCSKRAFMNFSVLHTAWCSFIPLHVFDLVTLVTHSFALEMFCSFLIIF